LNELDFRIGKNLRFGKNRGQIALDLYNALNRKNPLNFSGVLASPFFGQPTSAAAPRRIEIGTRFSF